MNQNRKATALIVAAVMLLAATPAVAQQSNLNAATASVFSSDVDNYLSVINFSKVTFDKSFAFAGLQNQNLDLGYATKLGGIYLGTWYDGDVVNMVGQQTTTSVVTTPTVVNNVISSTATTTTKTLTTDNPFTTDNSIGVLVGIAGMGFKLGFDEEMRSYVAPAAIGTLSSVTTDTADNSVQSMVYSNTSRAKGFMTPSVQWGMNLPLGNMTLKPTAKISVAFNTDYEGYTVDSTHTVDGSVPYGDKTTNIVSYTNNGYIAPNANLGALLSFAKEDGAQTTVGLNYVFDMPLYGEGTKDSTVMTENTISLTDTTNVVTDTVTTTPYFEMTNTVTPAFYYTKDFGDQLSVGVNAKASISLYNQKKTPTTVKTTTTTYDEYSQDPADDYDQTVVETTPGNTTETARLTVTPTVNLGFVYKVVPNKLSLNAGYAITAPTYTTSTVTTTRTATYSKTTTTTFGNGVVTSSTTATGSTTNVDYDDSRTETQTVTTTWGQLTGILSFGPTFNFTDNFTLDAVAFLATNGTASLFGTGANSLLGTSYSLMFTLKY